MQHKKEPPGGGHRTVLAHSIALIAEVRVQQEPDYQRDPSQRRRKDSYYEGIKNIRN